MTEIPLPISDITIIIPAAGIGERLGQGPKGLIEINGKPLIQWLAKKCLAITPHVIISAPLSQLSDFEKACPSCQIILGGKTRQESVELLCQQVKTPYVIIHDAARPFVSIELLNKAANTVKKYNVVGAFLTPDIPVAEISNGIVSRTFRKHEVGIFQSPQAFETKILLKALSHAKNNNIQEQSTLQLIPYINLPIHVIEGEKQNIKITTTEDWKTAQLFKDFLE